MYTINDVHYTTKYGMFVLPIQTNGAERAYEFSIVVGVQVYVWVWQSQYATSVWTQHWTFDLPTVSLPALL